MRNNLQAYQKIHRDSTLATADPHTIILMLFDGVLKSISIAKGAIERKELELKSTEITKAINIIRSFQYSLDKESEPMISKNFDELYIYCIDRLMDASTSLEQVALDEVVELLKPLRDAWRDISEVDKQEGLKLLNQKKKQESIIGL